MSKQYDLKTKDVTMKLGRTKEWVRLHSRFENPALPILPAVKVLGQYRWSQEDVDAFIAANTVTKD
jgi:hypothetical protein